MDETCINCDTCRWMQGDTFVHKDGKSAVVRQPETEVNTVTAKHRPHSLLLQASYSVGSPSSLDGDEVSKRSRGAHATLKLVRVLLAFTRFSPGIFPNLGIHRSRQEEKRGAYRALHACPTHSIRLESADPVANDALNDFPFPVDSDRLPGDSAA